MRRIVVLLGMLCVVTAVHANVIVWEPVASATSINASVEVDVDGLIKKAIKEDKTADLKQILEKYDGPLKKQGVGMETLAAVARNATKQQWDMILKYVKDETFTAKSSGYRDTLLHYAVCNEKAGLEITKFLVEEKKLDVNAGNKDGYTPIYCWSNGGTCDDRVTDYLVDHGADIESEDKGGSTLLIYACSWGTMSEKHALRLIERGADVFHERHLSSPLFAAAVSGQPKAVTAILKTMVDRSPHNEDMSTRYWVDRPLQARMSTVGPRTALMEAIDHISMDPDEEKGDRVGAVKALIAAGADVNYRWPVVYKNRYDRIGSPGQTPIYLAKNGDIARTLIAAGADVNNRDDSGRTPLDVCTRCFIDYTEVVPTTPASVALHAGVMDKLLEVVEVLLQNHADPFPNPKEPTPYQCAVKSGNQKLINIYRKYHADVVNPYAGFDIFGRLVHTGPPGPGR